VKTVIGGVAIAISGDWSSREKITNRRYAAKHPPRSVEHLIYRKLAGIGVEHRKNKSDYSRSTITTIRLVLWLQVTGISIAIASGRTLLRSREILLSTTAAADCDTIDIKSQAHGRAD
jgi:hypothetical protein